MNILIKNCSFILTQNKKRELIKDKSILIEDNKISAIGDIKNADEIIDAKGFLVIPSLINTHTHSSMTLFRGIAEDMPLKPWLETKIWPLERKLTGKLCYYGSLIACIEMIRNGITCFNDMYLFMNDVAKVCKQVGIRAFLGSVFFDFPTPEGNSFEVNKKFVSKWKNEELIKPTFTPHSTYSCSEELLLKSKELADKNNVLLHTHLAETKDEQEKSKEKNNLRQVEYLEKIGLLDKNVIAAHCCWLSEKEISILKNYNVKVSHNPVSNMKLSSGVAPVPEMIKNNITVSLGTDGAASNNSLDMFETMKVCSLLHKLNKTNPLAIKSQKIFDFSTIEGAKALLIDNEIGSIEIGKKADMVLIDLKKTNFFPLYNNLIPHLVYSCKGENVDTVICNGKILMKNREILTLDEKEVMKKAKLAKDDLLRENNLNIEI
ncbi:MAG: amidohydrolase family protein [Candidatus Aenigmarchaeota archaeon]|nr:amidohydrolase family protein [Candidatus Aenigmarchaeota archaeon]